MSRKSRGRTRPNRARTSRSRPGRAQRVKTTSTETDARADARRVRWTGALLFLLALALRLLFWQATPDANWPHSVYFKGDAPTWVEYARALNHDSDFELGLPLRPPGAGYLLSAIWDGRSELSTAQVAWCLLGALTVFLVYAAADRSFGYAVGLITGLLCAVSHGLMVLSTSLNNETPYLFLVACTLWLWPRLDAVHEPTVREPTVREPAGWTLWAWGILHALACLVRVEHLLFFMATTAWLAVSLPRTARRRSAAHVLAAFVLVLLPWHATAWSAIERFNTEPPDEQSTAARAQAQLEQALGPVEWTDEAAAIRDAWPAFSRRAAANFAAATVVYRAGPSPVVEPVVEPADLDALDDAFGSRPEPIPALPFVTFYGGLNFYLAHNPWAAPGFSRAALDQPPPLDDSQGPFPPILVNGLPPPDLAFTYPPHLHAITHGYGMGLRYLWSEALSQPTATARRMAARAGIFWDGASLGFGGFGLPATGEQLRRRADLAVPTGKIFRAWQLAWLALVLAGLWFGLRSRARPPIRHLVPWLTLAAMKLVVSLAFFGYARHGAGAFPALALLAALAVVGLARRRGVDLDTGDARRKLVLAAMILGVTFLALDAWRFADPPQIQLDGRGIESGDPWPIDIHEDRRLAPR